MYSKESIAIQQTIQNYFNGIFNGDTMLLLKVFHPNCLLIGDINGQPYFKDVNQYLMGVKERKSPSELSEPFRMEILSIEVLGNNAVAKLHVPMLGFNYYDFLSLSKINSEWVIVNKLFTNVN
ncbi:nuclear transport factor 2 family protein [Flavobacterium sedimenticola]|uniref:Nuclear transport factor 2 family protein n=1 Tax=Flavobacterium sedimenticola TaxID=3043286 RepID=A0ABT6XTJ1_9FLAO|nr:nuclear transport factor 2 family protein [Flavobacterium sedimenticola]MDI9257929.1 nuclear transport factor 2 family protein [Flavobacterium sedimenticola]